MLTIDIDTGGTMTDGLVSGDGQVRSFKVETTPHDVTIAFMELLDGVRESLGYADLRSLLADVDVIRWSSTITSNVLAQRTGPKIGLLVSAGHTDDLYDADAAAAVVGTLVEAEDISSIAPDADEQTVRRAIKSLLDRGIRRINVSLEDAFHDPSAEQRIIDLITEDYPDHFLGSIPALAGSEIVLRPDDATRTVASLINAYVHPALATTLYRAEETVRDTHGWRGNVLIGHINGGVARIGKTKAFDTIESGPIFGTYACAAAAREAGDGRVLAIDVGGTTAKVSAVEDGQPVLLPRGDLFDIPVELDMPLLRSVALGGGSIAAVRDGQVVLGPESMGAAPGPACYGLGGRKATVTDALLVVGFLSPTAFLDGRRTLDVEKAREALARDVGEPLGVDADTAATRVVEAAWDVAATLAREAAEEAGWDPSTCTVYGYGGNGPLFATAVAERLGASAARVFRHGSVYSAFGSAISDVVHVYECALVHGGEQLGRVADDLAAQARRDLRGEGFDPTHATFTWELRSDRDSQTSTGEGPSGIQDRLDGTPELVRLTARHPLPTLERSRLEPGTATPRDARPSPYGVDERIPTFDADGLVGAAVEGPALVDGGSFTWLATRGWRVATDDHGDAVLSRA